MVRLVKDTHKARADLFIREALFMKDRQGIMLLKVKVSWLMISRNIGIWEIG